MAKAIGIFWKARNYYDSIEAEGEPLPARRMLEISVETLRDVLKGIPAGFPDFENEIKGKLEKAEKELAELDQPQADPRVVRRDNILAIFNEEPVSKETAAELINELAEIDQALQFNPADAAQLAPVEEMIF